MAEVAAQLDTRSLYERNEAHGPDQGVIALAKPEDSALCIASPHCACEPGAENVSEL
jgi:hypothetical protein